MGDEFLSIDVAYIERLLKKRGEFHVWGREIVASYKKVALFSLMPRIEIIKKRKYIVYGAKNFHKMGVGIKSNAHVILTARDILRVGKLPTSFTYDLKSYAKIIKAIEAGDSKSLMSLEIAIRRSIEDISPKCFVANSTLDPINRLWIRIAHEMGVQTLCIQHGVYSSLSDFIQEEDIVDKYIALDKNQAQYLSKFIDPSKIVILGVEGSFVWKPPSLSRLKVCFIGEDLERYGYLERKISQIQQYKAIAEKFKIQANFFYKKHPSEINSLGIGGDVKIAYKEDLGDMNIFIGYGSSLLKEMCSKGKLAIQIMDPKMCYENFEKMGYCISIPFDDNLNNWLHKIFTSECRVPCILDGSIDDLIDVNS